MSYRPRSSKKSRWQIVAPLASVVLVLGCVVLLQVFAPHAFTGITQTVGRPILEARNAFSSGTFFSFNYLRSKHDLIVENNALKDTLRAARLDKERIVLIEKQNEELLSLFGRNPHRSEFVLGSVLTKPPFSPYDTVIIDAGTREGVSEGDRVYAEGIVPLGYVSGVYPHTSTIVLYSSAGETFNVSVGSTTIEVKAAGKGNGNFETKVPKNQLITPGDAVHLPGLQAVPFAKVEKILSTPADSFQTVLFKSPVNIHELNWLFVETETAL